MARRDARLGPLARDRPGTERTGIDRAFDLVAVDAAAEGKRERHGVHDLDLPGHLVAVHGAIEDRRRVALGGLGAGERAALGLERQLPAALAVLMLSSRNS